VPQRPCGKWASSRFSPRFVPTEAISTDCRFGRHPPFPEAVSHGGGDRGACRPRCGSYGVQPDRPAPRRAGAGSAKARWCRCLVMAVGSAPWTCSLPGSGRRAATCGSLRFLTVESMT
jgi:hypothetical protein